MRRCRSWKWRLADVGVEKGKSGPVVRICERERRAVDSATKVETGQQQLPWSKCMIAGRPGDFRDLSRTIAKVRWHLIPGVF